MNSTQTVAIFTLLFFLVIVVVVWRLHRFPEEFNTKRIPYKMMKNRMHYKAGILALLYIYPVFPLITSSMFWPAGVVIAFFVTMFVLPNIVWFGKLFTDDYEKDWNNREDIRIDDPELWAHQQEMKRQQMNKDALKNGTRRGAAFAAGYIVGKKTEL